MKLCCMETKDKRKKFDAVAFMRELRDLIRHQLSSKSKEEILVHLKKLDESTRNRIKQGT